VRVHGRRTLLLLAGAVILIGGLTAAASKFAPQCFGADDLEPTPAAVLAELRNAAREKLPGRGAWGEIDEARVVRLAAFDTANGRVTVYAAPLEATSGFCSVEAIGKEFDGGACDADGEAIEYVGRGSSAWADVRVVLGRLHAPASRVEVRFEDGVVKSASVRLPLWVYIVGGDETEPGHRPVELRALDANGAVVASRKLEPFYYTSQEAVEVRFRSEPDRRLETRTLDPRGPGPPPRRASGIRVRFEDGTSAEPDVSVASGFAAWLGPDRLEPGRRPTELVALDGSGRALARLPLDPEEFSSG
jgi:hypothetical protein